MRSWSWSLIFDLIVKGRSKIKIQDHYQDLDLWSLILILFQVISAWDHLVEIFADYRASLLPWWNCIRTKPSQIYRWQFRGQGSLEVQHWILESICLCQGLTGYMSVVWARMYKEIWDITFMKPLSNCVSVNKVLSCFKFFISVVSFFQSYDLGS